MVGAPGAFVYIPVMIYLLNIPTRIAIGSTLGIVFLGALAGAAGKMATGQILWPAAPWPSLSARRRARNFGGDASKKIDTKHLRLMISVIIANGNKNVVFR